VVTLRGYGHQAKALAVHAEWVSLKQGSPHLLQGTPPDSFSRGAGFCCPGFALMLSTTS
jgi:hypothetical protein